MNCPNCGDLIPNECEFCPKCGKSSTVASAQSKVIDDSIEVRREVPWWVSWWKPEITVRPNVPDKFVELYMQRRGGMVRTVTSRERWVRGTVVLFMILAGTLILILTPFLYYQGLTMLPVGLALLGLLVSSPWIWFQLWPFWLERKERQAHE